MAAKLYAGYEITDIDDLSKELLAAVDDTGTPSDLILLALCRAVVMRSTDEELDRACRIIDELSEVPHDWRAE